MVGQRGVLTGTLLVVWLFANAAVAKDIYVSPSGSDSNSGSSSGAPLRSLAAAARAAYPGDTVWLMQGRYAESIVPVRSGTDGQPITFRRYGTNPAVIVGSSDGTAGNAIYVSKLTDIVIDGVDVDGGRMAPSSALNMFATIVDSTRVTIRRGTFKYANGWGGVAVRNSSFVVIEDNDVDMVGTLTDNSGDAIEVRGGTIRSVLVQRNRVRHGGHDLLRFDGTNGVIQDNYFDNNWDDVFGGGRGYRSVTLIGSRNLFQRNYVSHAGVGPADHPTPMLMKVEGVDNVVRNNAYAYGVAEGVHTGAGSWTVNGRGGRIYSNTFYRLGGTTWTVEIYEGYSIVDYELKNNIVVDEGMSSEAIYRFESDVYFWVGNGNNGPTSQSRTVGNIFGRYGGSGARVYSDVAGGLIRLADAESRYPDLFSYNRNARAIFASSAPVSLADFKLKSGSPGIDEGQFLTVAVASGTSNRLPVKDSLYFTDGFGVVLGDVIQLEGSTQRPRVIAVDTVSHILTLSNEIRFDAGQGVALAYAGSRPDLGAQESGTDAAPEPPLISVQ